MARFTLSILLAAGTIASSLSAPSHAAIDDHLTRSVRQPDLTQWAPQGPRVASRAELEHPVLPASDHFFTIHGGVRSADEVPIVFAPVFEQSWNAESNAFVTESPAFGADGSSWFIPASLTTNADGSKNMMIVLSAEGERRFSVTEQQLGEVSFGAITQPASFGAGAAALVLNNPDTGGDVGYGASFTRAWAVDGNGNLLWNTPLMPASIEQAIQSGDPDAVSEEFSKPHRVFGINYHPTADAIIVADLSGDLIALDRKTGAQIGALQMPGSPATGGDNLLSSDALPPEQVERLLEVVMSLASQTMEDSGIEFASGGDITPFLAILGGGAVIGNQISIDPNSDSLWVASTDLDENDSNPGDGLSEKGALYRIDLTRNSNELSFDIVCSAPFEGGTTSTPAVSADGERVYTTDNFGAALSFDRNCEEQWRVEVGEAAVASLAVSSEVGAEIYYPTLTTIYKIQENSRRDGAEVIWQANLDSSFRSGSNRDAAEAVSIGVRRSLGERSDVELSEPFAEIGAFNLDLATIGQNGIMIHSGFGLILNIDGFKLGLPIALNNGLYDRTTGEFINATPALEENIGAMYTAADGTIIMGSSPIRRGVVRALVKAPDFYLPDLSPTTDAIADAIIDWLVRPLAGGVTKYGIPRGFDLLARDAACQAEKRISNADINAPLSSPVGLDAEVHDTLRLIEQARQGVSSARSRFEMARWRARRVNKALDNAEDLLNAGRLSDSADALSSACGYLQ